MMWDEVRCPRCGAKNVKWWRNGAGADCGRCGVVAWCRGCGTWSDLHESSCPEVPLLLKRSRVESWTSDVRDAPPPCRHRAFVVAVREHRATRWHAVRDAGLGVQTAWLGLRDLHRAARNALAVELERAR